MIINIVGDCDKRPVLYTVMKICQTLGDTLLVTTDNRMLRLSDTRENQGHYQNVMIAVATDGIDDFFEEFIYGPQDFANVIVDGMVSADADTTIYVKGLMPSEEEEDMLEYLDEYSTIKLYEGKAASSPMFLNCEKFEAFKTFAPINATIAAEVADALAKVANTSAVNLSKIAMAPAVGSNPGKAAHNVGGGSGIKSTNKKKGLFGGRK